MVISVAVIANDSSPLYLSVNEKESSREFDIQMFIYCSLDIVDEKVLGANKTLELYLGPLISDQNFKSFGYVTNTNVKMIIVTEIGDTSLKDQDIRSMFKRLHNAYCNSLSNPFYVPGQLIKSKVLDETAKEIFAT
uniref:Trafficking protein particle complex subunit 2-like protein n=1 Tax=Wuchereria bancrofti TaxID=6293 RepID=A0A1I8EGG0_WUCBA